MHSRTVLIGLVFTLALACFAPTSVLAAPSAPLPEEMDVQLWAGAQAGQAIVIVGVSLPADAELPAVVRIPVISGMTVDWAGEIAGQEGQDQQHEFELKQGTGGQYAEFEVTRSRSAQIELSGVPLTVNGSTTSAAIDFIQTAPATVTAFSVRVPAGAADVTIDPSPSGAADQNEAGESLYTLPSKELADGASQRVSVGYTTGGTTSKPASGATPGVLVGVLIGLLVLAAAVLAFVLGRQRESRG